MVDKLLGRSDRKIRVSWEELRTLLQKSEVLFSEEKIREVTLVKPRGLLLHLRR